MGILTLLILLSVLFNYGIKINVGLSKFQHPRLLVVSYDAFRYDYFDRNLTPFIDQVRRNNTYTKYMHNAFVTKTFPNHHTMATGLFVENHGVVGNTVFDVRSNKTMNYSHELFNYDSRTLPIWTVNEKAGDGRHSGTMMWPGAEFPYQGITPTFAQVYNTSIPWRDRVDKIISWFKDHTTPINLALLYIEEPDIHGHALGINSKDFNKVLKDLDVLTEYLHDALYSNGLGDVNVIHVSDHGMKSITMNNIINLTNLVNTSDFEVVDSSPGRHIFPKPGKFHSVYEQLKQAARKNKHFVVYRKEEIPEKYHYSNNPRIGPIFILANLGFVFNDIYANIAYYEKTYNFTATNETEFGIHGYDNSLPEMWPMFFAYGPLFRTSYEIAPFNNVDLYPLFCEILHLSCPTTNGTLEHVQNCLKSHSNFLEQELNTIFIGVLLLIGIIIGIIIFIIKRRRNKKMTQYRILSCNAETEYHLIGDQDHVA